MWHADEGLLSAYVDGELGSSVDQPSTKEIEVHLATCAECRALLEDVKRARDRAADILASSGPSALEMPPFEELRARKEARSQRQQVRQLNRTRVLAWAATIVLAAGVGWFARDAILTREAARLDAPRLPTALTVEAQDEVADALEQERDMDAPAEPSAATAGRAANIAPATPQLAGNEPARQRSVTAQDAEARGAAAEGAIASTAQKSELRVAEPEVEEQIVSPVAADSRVVVRRELDAARRARESGFREQFADAAPAGRAESAAAQAPVLNRTIIDDRTGVSSRWDALTWETVTASAAQITWGGIPPQVAGLPVSDHSRATISGRTAIRVTQPLDSQTGTFLEVISYRPSALGQQRQLATPEAVPGLVTTGIPSELSEQRGDYTVVVRAAVSPDSLTALLRRVVPQQD